MDRILNPIQSIVSPTPSLRPNLANHHRATTTTTSERHVEADSRAYPARIDASESATRPALGRVYIVVIFRETVLRRSVGNLAPEDGIYAEVNRLLPRKSEVIEC